MGGKIHENSSLFQLTLENPNRKGLGLVLSVVV